MTAGEIETFLDGVVPAKRQRDARMLLPVFARATGVEPHLWGSIIAYGTYHYEYASGHTGDAPAAAFAPRKSATVVYLSDGVEAHADALERIGPHRAGVGCLYFKDVAAIDIAALEQVIAESFATLTAGVFTNRARDGGTQRS